MKAIPGKRGGLGEPERVTEIFLSLFRYTMQFTAQFPPDLILFPGYYYRSREGADNGT